MYQNSKVLPKVLDFKIFLHIGIGIEPTKNFENPKFVCLCVEINVENQGYSLWAMGKGHLLFG